MGEPDCSERNQSLTGEIEDSPQESFPQRGSFRPLNLLQWFPLGCRARIPKVLLILPADAISKRADIVRQQPFTLLSRLKFLISFI